MPKTKFQSVIFTAIMVFSMVYSMTVYTMAVENGKLDGSIFVTAIKEMWVEYAVVWILIFFIITNIAKKAAFRIVNPKEDKPIFIILAVQSFTVMCIVPAITLFATFFHHGFTNQWFVQWVTTACLCFPMAYCLQIFFIGPLVRTIFKFLFSKQLKESSC